MRIENLFLALLLAAIASIAFAIISPIIGLQAWIEATALCFLGVTVVLVALLPRRLKRIHQGTDDFLYDVARNREHL